MSKLKIFQKNEKGRDFIIGDLHGAYSCLLNGLDNLKFDYQNDRLFSVGDLIDRGPESLQCLRLLTEDWFYSVMGNHELMMEDTITHCLKKNDFLNFYNSIWHYNGGQWFSDILAHTYMEEIISLVEIIKILPYMISVNFGDDKMFHVIHAEFNENKLDEELRNPNIEKSLDELNRDYEISVLWNRRLFANLYKQDLKIPAVFRKIKRTLSYHNFDLKFNSGDIIYSGHTTVMYPTKIGNCIDLDTGAFASYHGKQWAGITIVEPSSNTYWKSTENSFEKSELITIL